MHRAVIIVLFTCWFASAQETHEWVLPWVSNLDGTWTTRLIIDNPSDSAAMVTLSAVRQDGSSETLEAFEIPAKGQWVADAGTTFSTLGSGPGYAAFVRSENGFLVVSESVASARSASGNSPALSGGKRTSQGATRLILPFLPAPGDGFAATVLVNVGAGTANASIQAYTASGNMAGQAFQVEIPSGRPFAELSSNMFADLSADSYFKVSSSQPLVGMSFSFNAAREPSMTLAEADSSPDPQDVALLTESIEATGAALNGYSAGIDDLLAKGTTPGTCPALEIRVPGLQNNTFSVNADWGAGCTNSLGVFHAGQIDLSLEREGNLTDGAWMSGNIAFSQFVTQSQALSYTLNGNLQAEASTLSKDIFIHGMLTTQFSDGVQNPVTYNSSVTLTANGGGDGTFVSYGQIGIVVEGTDYGSIQASVSQGTPLLWQLASCPYPVSGIVDLTIYYQVPVRGTLNFDTGNCFTALLTVAGQSQEIPL